MAYVVLARKWRPQRFGDLVGQEHVARTLANAIREARVAHAFLFTGPRGVGKTSAARIFAKALNCETATRENADPCDICVQCREITEGRSTDVFEIDAASHTGVDHIREIIENVRYLPSSGRYKIYVIDEVHMLSIGAFNALLKTLEEPPEHVKFILATTDVHKVPVTILSRCQRYDFRRISSATIAERLEGILQDEKQNFDPGAMHIIAKEAAGSMRDAQSLLEQVLAFAPNQALTVSAVEEALGVVDRKLVTTAFLALVERQPGNVFEIVDQVYQRGLDLKRFGDALIEYARDVLVAKLTSGPQTLIDRTAEEITQLQQLGRKLDVVDLERLFEGLCGVVESVGRALQPRFQMEIGLAILAEQPPRVPLAELISSLQRVENQLDGSQVAADPKKKSLAAPPSKTKAQPSADAVPISTTPAVSQAVVTSVPPATAAVSEAAVPASGVTIAKPELVSATETRTSPVHVSDSEAGGAVRDGFLGFIAQMRKKRPALAATLSQVRPVIFTAEVVSLGVETSFDFAKLTEPDTADFLQACLKDYLGATPKLETIRLEKNATAALPATLNEITDQQTQKRTESRRSDALNHPVVKLLSETLGAEIAKVRVFEES